MNKIIAAGITAFALFSGQSQATAAPYAITGATLVEAGPEVETLENSYVVIDGSHIAAVGQGPLPAEYDAIKTIDLHGKFITPGLIDSHVHLGSLPGIPHDGSARYQPLIDAYYSQEPKSFLYYGFTTVIDLNDNADIIALEKSEPVRPNIYGCGSAMVLANGYPMLFYPKNIRFKANPNFVFNDNQLDSLPDGIDPTKHTPAAAVARIKAGGAICAKFFYEKGFFPGSNWPLPSDKLFAEVRAATRAASLPLVVHANAEYAQKAALDHHADILAHGLWHWQDADGQASDTPGKSAYALLDRIIASGTGYMPTLQVLAGEAALLDPTFVHRAALKAVVPPILLTWYQSPEGQKARTDTFGNMPDDKAQAFHAADITKMKRSALLAKYLADRGGKLLFGTDTPSAPTWGNPVGLNGLYEMRTWAAAGIPMATLLKAATYENARAFGLENRYGSVRPGKVADILIMDENPLSGPDAFESIERIISRGTLIDRASLRADHP